jgi:hypothetical protein
MLLLTALRSTHARLLPVLPQPPVGGERAETGIYVRNVSIHPPDLEAGPKVIVSVSSPFQVRSTQRSTALKEIDDVLGGDDSWQHVDKTAGWGYVRLCLLLTASSRLRQMQGHRGILLADSDKVR